MRRIHSSSRDVNRRRIIRRRRASVVVARSKRRLSSGSLFLVPARLKKLYPKIQATLMAAAAGIRPRAAGLSASVSAHVSVFADWARHKAASAFRLGRAYAVRLSAIAGEFQARLAHAIAGAWLAANSEIELVDAERRIRPYLQAATGLFALMAVSVAVFTAWHTLRGKPEPAAYSFASLHDHHPPLAAPVAQARYSDLETEFVHLPFGAEDEPVTSEQNMLAKVEDIDAQNWFDEGLVALYEPGTDEAPAILEEENLEAAMAGLSPRAMPRPETPLKPAITGIPIQPEPPFGTAPIQPAQPAWLANAVVSRQQGNGPMIAIVIDDAGVVQHRTRRASELPAPVTIAFIPYSNNLESQTRYARSRGHELLLHMPMEPGSTAVDPGHNALLTSLGRDEVLRRLRWAMNRFEGYVGVNNHMGSKFMAQPELVRPVLEEINSRGLLFLDSRTDHRTVGGELARDIGMPNAIRNVFLDNDLDSDKIAAQLAQVEKVARKRGQAIAIGHPHDVTVDVLARWIPEARKKGFRLVPVSAIVKKEYETQLAQISR